MMSSSTTDSYALASSTGIVGPSAEKRFRRDPDHCPYVTGRIPEHPSPINLIRKSPGPCVPDDGVVAGDVCDVVEQRRTFGCTIEGRCRAAATATTSNGGSSGSSSVETQQQLGRRHLVSSSPPYGTAAVTHSNDTELLSNGDSGFQDLDIPEEMVTPTLKTSESPIMIENRKEGEETEPELGTGTKEEGAVAMVEPPEDEDGDSNVSVFSYGSDLSNLSGEAWKPINSNIGWIQRQIENGADPKAIIRHLTGSDIVAEIDDFSAWRLVVQFLSEPALRPKLPTVNTIDDVLELIKKSSKIIVLTGAGVSVSCGIPDFRSRNGIYARLSKDYPDLPDPQSMFDIHYFNRNPYPFFKFAKEIYPGQFQPSPSHKFIKYIEMKGKLLRNYSQNIDTLEQTAGIKNVITCHGSFATATCTVCGFKVDCNAIREEIFAQTIPLCPRCMPENSDRYRSENDLSSIGPILPVMKPDIVFFGEGLSDEFHNSMAIDKDQCDLLIVIGSSLKVRPVALIPNSISENIPQILINREPLNHFNFDVELLGDCDVIVEHLCKKLGDDWLEYCFGGNTREKQEEEGKTETFTDDDTNKEYEFVPQSRYIFKGAEVNDTMSSDSDDDGDDDDDDNCSNDSDTNNPTNTTPNDSFNEQQKTNTTVTIAVTTQPDVPHNNDDASTSMMMSQNQAEPPVVDSQL